MATDNDCVFCKIVRGEIPANKVYEDNGFLAFLDIKPIAKGHTLIIPKKHCKNLLDFPKPEESDVLEFIKKVAAAVVKATNADGFNLGMNNGKAAGQVIHHAHFHVIPRFDHDGLHTWPNNDTTKEELGEMQKKVTGFLK